MSGEKTISYRRFWVALAVWLAILAMVAGGAQTFQVVYGLRKLGGLEYASRVTSLAVVRELAAGTAFAAGLFAWVTWTHGQDAELVRERFRSTALRVMLAAPFAHAVAASCALATSFVLATSFGIAWAQSVAGYRTAIGVLDWAVGMVTTVSALAALVIAAWFAMPRLAATPWGLPRKIVTAWLGIAAIRSCIALVEAAAGLVFG